MNQYTSLVVAIAMLDKATEFEILPETVKNHRTIGEITIKRRVQRDGKVLWAIYLRGDYVLDKNGDWLMEPIPSSRTDEFLQSTRFELMDAWLRAQNVALSELKKAGGK